PHGWRQLGTDGADHPHPARRPWLGRAAATGLTAGHTDGMADGQEWAERRREAAQEHADRLARRRAAETARAREMIHDFAREAQARGITAAALLARAGDGKPTYRTGLTGWYLNRD